MPSLLLALLVSCTSVSESDTADTSASDTSDTSPPDADCDMAVDAAALAGSGATDCGLVEPGADGTEAWACALTQFNAGAPYFVRVQRWGTDTLLESALVSNGTKTWRLAQDREDNPPWNIDAWDCLSPVEGIQPDDEYDDEDISGYPIVTCTSTAPEGNHYQECGEICDACSPQPLPFEP
ncbi:MAG: hypothetical protein Q8P18_01270 [Pseudomonadota bacterium]|nr:hypothetical protein [Pseudomonadota bacterium]